MTLEYLEIMEEEKRKAGSPRKVRGTATFHDDDTVEFVPQGKGEPVQKSVKKYGDARFYETEGEKTSSYVAHLKVNKDAADPAAELHEQLEHLTKGMKTVEPAVPRIKSILDKPGVTVWHRKLERKVIIRMEIDLATSGELSSKLFNLTAEVNKCFAINQKNLGVVK